MDEKPDSSHLAELNTAETQVHIDPEVEKIIVRKFDKHIVPWLFGLWLLAFIDRSNIGNARIAGLTADLKIMDGNKFNTALAIFYVPYILIDGL